MTECLRLEVIAEATTLQLSEDYDKGGQEALCER